MKKWSDDFNCYLEKKLDVLDKNSLLDKFSWVEDVYNRANCLLSPKALNSISPNELYAGLVALSVPGFKIKVTNLGRENNVERIRESLITLITEQGDFEQKYRASKFPQAGRVTVSELLGITKPIRFYFKNAAFTRGLAQVVPFYTKKAIDELSYDDLYDICNELSRIMIEFFTNKGCGDFARKYKFLLLYALLVLNKQKI